MLIGIDMLAVQSPRGADRDAGRYGRQLVAALLARDPVNRYVLYAHEGLPVDRIPSARNASRASLAPVAGRPDARRPSTQRLLDRDPDGLDWLILLDPFEAHYGGLPPEAPLAGPKVATVVHRLARSPDDRRMIPLRGHDAILAVSEAVAADCRRWLGVGSRKVAAIGVASDAPPAPDGPSEPLTRVSGDELGRLGISGPFVLAGSSEGADLGPVLDAYHRLPIERRRGHQLVIAGPTADPGALRSYLRDRGADDGLVLPGEVPEATLRALLGRCSAYLDAEPGRDSGLSLVEAMRSGAPVIAGRGPASAEVVGEAGLVVDPAAPGAMADALDALLTEPDLVRDLRRRAGDRSGRFTFGPVVDAVLGALAGPPTPSGTRYRVDRSHAPRPRIALFPDVARDGSGRVDLASQVPDGWRESYGVDLYFEPGDAALADGLPPEFGGFDARLFERNDAILGYHAVAHRIADAAALESRLARLRRRPGLVFLLDHPWLDRVDADLLDAGSDEASERLRELFRTGSRVVVPSPRHFDRIQLALPEFADRLAEVPPDAPADRPSEARRERARARLDLLPETLVIAQFGRSAHPLLTPRTFKGVARECPRVVLLAFDSGRDEARSRMEAKALGVADRFLHVGALPAEDAGDLIALIDLAIHPGRSGSVAILDLLKAGVPTISLGHGYSDAVVLNLAPSARGNELAHAVLALASDPEARSALGRAARAYCVGTPDPARASAILVGQVERCAADLPRVAGRRRPPARAPRGLMSPPHFPRPASLTDEAATPSR